MVKTIQSANPETLKISSKPDTEKSMQELTTHLSMIQQAKNQRENCIQEACDCGFEAVEQNILSLKTEIKKLKSNREFLMAQLFEERLLQNLEAKKILMNKALLK